MAGQADTTSHVGRHLLGKQLSVMSALHVPLCVKKHWLEKTGLLKRQRGFPSIFRRTKKNFPYHEMFFCIQVTGMRRTAKQKKQNWFTFCVWTCGQASTLFTPSRFSLTLNRETPCLSWCVTDQVSLFLSTSPQRHLGILQRSKWVWHLSDWPSATDSAPWIMWARPALGLGAQAASLSTLH